MRRKMTTLSTDDRILAIELAKVAVEAPHALSLALQLFGVEPCPQCQYIKRSCRCHEQGKGIN